MGELINLLPNRSKLDFQRFKLEERVKKTSFLVLGGVVFLGLIIFIFRFYFSWQLKKSQRALTAAKAEFAQFLPLIEEEQNLRFRIKLAADVLEKRSSVGEELDWFNQLLGEKGFLLWLKIKDKKIEAKGEIKNSQAVKEVEGKLEKEKGKGKWGKIELSSLEEKKNGSWEFSLNLEKK